MKSAERSFVLMDIDHTLADAYWRDHLVGDQGWDEYHAASINDSCVPEVVQLVRALADLGMTIVCVTGRPDKWRMLTTRWLVTQNCPMHELLMRPEKDFRPTHQMKVELVKERFGDAFPKCVAFIIDNDERIVESFKAMGVTALQIHIRRT